jgi:hypothetical protein
MPWELTGNAGTNPAIDFLGTTDAQPLVIKTNSTINPTEALRVDTNGNIGIGTTSPGEKLHVISGSIFPGEGILTAANPEFNNNDAVAISGVIGRSGGAVPPPRGPLGVLGWIENPEAARGIGIRGVSNASALAIGALGESLSGTGVLGESEFGTGVKGQSSSGTAVHGVSASGLAGLFDGNVDVNGNVHLNKDGSAGPELLLTNPNVASKNSVIYLGSGVPGPGGGTHFFISNDWRGNNTDQLSLGYNNAGNWTEHLVITRAGNVGIGTTIPTGLLHLNKAGTAGPVLLLTNPDPHSRNSVIFLGAGDPGQGSHFFISNDWGGSDTGRLSLGYNQPGLGTEHLIITTVGNVGIGTTSPQGRLHVNGDLHVTGGSIFVNSTRMNVPDYVFAADYPLLSLDELRAYLAAEKHLPNVPSAKTIQQGDLDMIEFQMKLLEKIEELTLYTLAQDEQIKAQQAQLELIQQQNAVSGRDWQR